MIVTGVPAHPLEWGARGLERLVPGQRHRVYTHLRHQLDALPPGGVKTGARWRRLWRPPEPVGRRRLRLAIRDLKRLQATETAQVLRIGLAEVQAHAGDVLTALASGRDPLPPLTRLQRAMTALPGRDQDAVAPLTAAAAHFVAGQLYRGLCAEVTRAEAPQALPEAAE